MLNFNQQHLANRSKFSALLPFGMDRTQQRQERRRRSFTEIRTRYSTNAALSEALGEGFSPSYVSQLLSGHRGIGDDVADKIEDRLSLETGWLDQDRDATSKKDKLAARLASADDATRALVEMALSCPDEPLPEGLSPTLRTMVEMVRTAIANDIKGHARS